MLWFESGGATLDPKSQVSPVPHHRGALPRGQRGCSVCSARHCSLLLCQLSDQAASPLHPHLEKGLIFISKMPEMHLANSKIFTTQM